MITPKKLGVRLNPPALVYLYEESGKLRMRVMPIRNLLEISETDFILKNLRSRHSHYLKPVADEKITKMIEIIKAHKIDNKKLDEIILSNKTKINSFPVIHKKEIEEKKIESNNSLINIGSNKKHTLVNISKIKSLMNEFDDFDFDFDKSDLIDDLIIDKIKKQPKIDSYKEEKDNSSSIGFSRLQIGSDVSSKKSKVLPPVFMTKKNERFKNNMKNISLKKKSLIDPNRIPFENFPSDDTDAEFSDGDNPLDMSD